METTLINKSNFKGLTVSLSKEFKVAASEKGSGFSYHWISLNGTPYLGGKAFEEALIRQGWTSSTPVNKGDQMAAAVLADESWEIAQATTTEGVPLTTTDGVEIGRIQRTPHCVLAW